MINKPSGNLRVAASSPMRPRVTAVGGASAAAAVFAPTDIAGLKLWLKADAGLFQERTGASATTPASADADPVGSWLDQSGNANHATATADSKRPTLKLAIQNGMAVLRFDNTDDYFSLPLNLASGSFSVYAALLGPTTNDNNRYLLDAQTGRLIIAPRAAAAGFSDINVGWYDGSWHDIAAGTTNWQVLTWILTSGGNGQIFRDGTSLGTAAYTAKAIGGSVTLGTGFDGAGPFLSTDLGEVILYTGAHTATQRQNVEAWLRTRWGTP